MSSEKKPTKDEGTTARAREASDSYDAIRESATRAVDEFGKIQSQISQSVTNLQQECIAACKNMVQNSFNAQKQITAAMNIQLSNPVMEQAAKQSVAMTDNILRSATVFGQLVVNATDAARENMKIYNKTVDAATEFGTNMAKAWTSLQPQYFRTS